MAQSNLQKLGSYLRPHWKSASLGIFALLIVNAVGVYLPLLIRDGVNNLQVTFSTQTVVSTVLWLLVLASIMWAIRMVSRILLFGVGRQVEFDLKQAIFGHFLRLDSGYFATHTVGDLINRATSDVDNIRRLLGFAVLSLANTLFAYVLTLPVMLSIHLRLSVLAIAVYPLMLFAVQIFSNRLRKEQQDVQEELSRVSDLIQEDMSGISLIKIYAQEDNERQAFRQFNHQLLGANLKLARTRNFLFPLVEALASLSLLVILWMGTQEIARGSITIGDFLALLLYVERLVFPTALLGFTISAYQRGEVSINRIEEILKVQPKIKNESQSLEIKTAAKGQLVARHLSYTYPGSSTPALNNINFTIHPGETIAIVGPIGSGKSTLAKALPRLLPIPQGRVFLDSYDITKLNLADLRSAIAFVPQDSFLFSTTIKNNVRYGDPLAEQFRVEGAATVAQIHPEILNFPQHYETLVGERGITLSGGQRQRSALARALLIDAPVLILDDCLSSVDNQTATGILRNLSTGTRKKTVLFISHQLSAAATADRLFVMERGCIVQVGTHRELIEQEGLYQTLWNKQQFEELLK
ncbi:ABC transporter ATP-binding protein [Roseofilum capinflatum]|uniref:ABC transporter ATP-binding protein n=1 Tax=Roseofilum capinflatum BLCC-M114 TaxID=3022440 RepID=A0ABT7B6R6_9CYAN|nr:ABC transporter ATP-binding protein [Roseofilum capinflatum]MDJ1173993.1 ABC transporter ATP-binding protein [Roseofilum capinflatum BLCC-M114]MDJ1177058.1 ABC transporter ATP-binding protein [Roseofilum capinflatum BLCC-M114]